MCAEYQDSQFCMLTNVVCLCVHHKILHLRLFFVLVLVFISWCVVVSIHSRKNTTTLLKKWEGLICIWGVKTYQILFYSYIWGEFVVVYVAVAGITWKFVFIMFIWENQLYSAKAALVEIGKKTEHKIATLEQVIFRIFTSCYFSLPACTPRTINPLSPTPNHTITN